MIKSSIDRDIGGAAAAHGKFDAEVFDARSLSSMSLLSTGSVAGGTLDASADPYAGTKAPNGKEIWTAEEAAENLNRNGTSWAYGNDGALDDGVLTFGFWTYEQFMDSYFGELRYSDGSAYNDDAYYAETYGLFEAFRADQMVAAANAIALWDDLVNIKIEAAAPGEEADIMFGAVYMSPAAGAHAYYPQAEAINNYYGTSEYGKVSGDVMINWYYNSPNGDPNNPVLPRDADDSFSDFTYGSYGNFAITHELGHSLGLSHGGDYNASAGQTITYEGNAYFYQDSQQYTIMSYFSGRKTGQAAIDFDKLVFLYAQTPAVHDILAVQNMYGADHTTRAGDTVYGFNSNAGSGLYDFTQNKIPIITIWDGAGNDTLDLSGFTSNSVIDINDGAFSSAGYAATAEQRAFLKATFGYTTDAQLTSFFTRNGVKADGSPIDNIGIAYGANIENAVGGVGNDTIKGNGLDNKLVGNGGNDTIFGGAGDDKLLGGDANDILIGGTGNDTLTGGAGADKFVFVGNDGNDRITDFKSGVDKIDLTAFGIDASAVKMKGTNLFVDSDHNGSYDLHIVVQGSGVQMSDLMFHA
ncbi:MAG TPA: M10 family metallopeptidase C-terminal domain-containing protein [Sphingomicrobium sp.]|jgi:serralysin